MIHNRHLPLTGVLLPLLLLASGCTTMLTSRGEPEYAAVNPVYPTADPRPSSAIYSPATSWSLFEDLKARRVGDTLTVILDERTDASKSAVTEITKENDTNISAPKVLGQDVKINGDPISTSLESASDFAGEADSSQSNKLMGSITVTVAQVLPNGNLVVQGEKWIAINQGDEYVRLRGIVRPYDIDPANTVLSTRVADAQIIYRGKGTPAEANSMGWLARFFNTPIWAY